MEKQSQSVLSSSLEMLLKDSRGKKRKTVANTPERNSFRDHDLFSQVHYLWKKASVLRNQLKRGDRMEGLKNKCECTSDKSV